MARTADFVVIGGGVFGCAVAWNLARLGARRVVLLERRELGAATTSLAAALLTRVRTKPAQTEIMSETREAIGQLERELDRSLDLRRVGSLHVAASDASERALDQLEQCARACDEPIERLDRADAEARVPWLCADGARRIVLMPLDGFVDPYRLAQVYAEAARRRGVELRTGTAVTALARDAGAVTGVVAAGETIAAGCVIDAAGPWSGLLAAEAGWHLPMAPVRSHYWITVERPEFPRDHPCVVLPDAHAYTRPEVGGLLFGLRDRQSLSRDPRALPEDLSRLRYDEDPDGWEVLRDRGPGLARFFPALEDTPIAHYVAGPSTYTPDRQLVLGRVPGVDGLLVCSGCCGAGISASGGVGRAIAELALRGATGFDLEPFRPDRFGPVDAFGEPWLRRCAESRARKTSG